MSETLDIYRETLNAAVTARLENKELPDGSRPELTLLLGEQEHWDHLINTITAKIEAGEAVAVSLVRCWNKDEQSIEDFAGRFTKIRKHLPELLGAMVSINANPNGDKNHMTTNAVKAVREKQNWPISTAEVTNYTWTAGLNGPTALLYHLLKTNGLTSEQLAKVYILNQSFDVEINEEASKQLSKVIREGNYALTIREESGMYTQEPGKRVELGNKIKEAIRNPELIDKPEFTTELARAARNTGMIVPLADIVEMGGFSNVCNQIGGMEDHDLYMRLLLKELDAVRRGGAISDRLKNMLKAFNDPVIYNDPAWNKMVTENKHGNKVEHEAGALKKITDRIQKLHATAQKSSDYMTPSGERDFIFAS